MSRRQWRGGLVLSPVLAIAWRGDAQAYRPFDGTDAAIAEPGQVEVELGPAQYLQIGSERTLVAPTVVFNYGLSERWELVLQGEAVHSLMEDFAQVEPGRQRPVSQGDIARGQLAGQTGAQHRDGIRLPAARASMTTRPTAPAAALRESSRSNGRG